MRQIVASLDIGTYKIKLVVAELREDGLNILCAIDEESRGIVKGEIIDSDETVYAIKKLLKKEEDLLGIKVTKVIVSINEERASFKIGEASIKIGENESEIAASDVVRVLQTSVKGNVDNDFDLITVVPIMFKVDDRKTRIPKGLKGTSLSVKSVVVSAPKRDIYLAAKTLEKCGLEVVDIMIPSIGSYFAHKNESTDTTTGVVIDCGYETINVSIVNKGIIINNAVLPIGGKNVDSDIMYVYKVNESEARELKENMALANKKNALKNIRENYVNSEGENIVINQLELSDLTMSRVREMLNMAKNEINYLTKKEISYIIITGGLSELKDFSIEVESVFGRVATIGKIQIVGARDNKYASCIGMIKYFDTKLKLRDKEYSIFSDDDEETLSGMGDKKGSSDTSILSKVFGIFFDN
ncbi:MAG: cell division protein FtsA [Erysipelotrichales bacterium]|nr:cell division protein FtsA [Erysipelotrichales bacterium]